MTAAPFGIHSWPDYTTPPTSIHTLSAAEALAFSPDGKTLAIAGTKTIQLWNVASGRPTTTLQTTFTDQISSVTFSPDSKTVAAGSDEGPSCSGEPDEPQAQQFANDLRMIICTVAYPVDVLMTAPGGGLSYTGQPAAAQSPPVSTGSSRSPLTEPLAFQRSSPSGIASRNSGNLWTRAPIAICTSTRARLAPRQKCGPQPNDR